MSYKLVTLEPKFPNDLFFQPKLLVTASFGIEPGRRVEYIPLVKKALEMSSHRPTKVLIYNRPNMVKTIAKMLFSFSTVSSSTLNDSLKSSKVSVGGRDFCGACTSRLLPGSNSKVFPCWLQPGAIFSCCSVTASRCLVLLHLNTAECYVWWT